MAILLWGCALILLSVKIRSNVRASATTMAPAQGESAVTVRA